MEQPFLFLAEKMKIIHLAYEDGDYTHRLADIGAPAQLISMHKAYRIIILSKSLNDEELDWGGLATAQFSHEVLQQPYQSWSKTPEAAKKSVKERNVEGYPYLLIEGNIRGFDLGEVSQYYIKKAKRILNSKKAEAFSDEDLYKLAKSMKKLEASYEQFVFEQEIVSVEVKDYLFHSSAI